MRGSDPIDDLFGILDLGCSTDEFIAEMRGDPDGED
jgi:hypothetical protein